MEEGRERQRLAALHSYGILDTPPEPSFDDITELTASLFRVPIALVSLVDRDRQWFKSMFGVDVRETARSVSFCHHAIEQDGVFLIQDATEDVRFRDNPLVISDPKIRFYAGVPLRTPAGQGLGTLCIIDRVPRSLSSSELDLLRGLARQVESQLELSRRSHQLEQALAAERSEQSRGDRLAVMLAHELRNPLTGIAVVAMERQLGRSTEGQRDLEDILDLADDAQRTLANALDVSLERTSCLRPRLESVSWNQLIGSVRSRMARAARRREVHLDDTSSPTGLVRADPELLQRALTNVVQHALRHAPADSAVRIEVVLAEGEVHFRTSVEGPNVSDAAQTPIFELEGPHDAAPMGNLGLVFCAAAARAHQGRTWVEETPRGSVFVLAVPHDLH